MVADYSVFKGLLVRQSESDQGELQPHEAWQSALEGVDGIKGVEEDQEVHVQHDTSSL